MKTIEHRRHTMRVQPGQHLSQAGVDLARRVGEGMGKFDLVVTSHLPRAFETAIAMGFAVDRQDELLATVHDGLEHVWDGGFARLTQLIRETPDDWIARFARGLADLHRDIAAELPDGGQALIVSHGGFVEAAAIGSVPDVDLSSWGAACDYCEGVRMRYDGRAFCDPEVLRVA